MSSDPFCSYDEFKGTLFYVTKHFNVIYDIKPVARGHTLIVSKRHIEDVTELTDEEAADLHKTMAAVTPKLLSIYCPMEKSYDITMQIGEYSGRTVPHLHVHIIPRTKTDGYQGNESAKIFSDVALNRSKASMADVLKEVKVLRAAFKYKPQRE